MKRRRLVQSIAVVVLAVFAIGIWANGDELNADWLRFFSVAVLAGTAALGMWDRWLWRVDLAQRVKGVPRNLGGTWKGTLTSFWIDPTTGEAPPEKPAFLVVRQTASEVSVILLTDESRSDSSLAVVRGPEGAISLDYMYLNRPDSRHEHRSRIHHGSASLDVTGRPVTRLKGRYWTDRGSQGELGFIARSARTADDYDEARGFFKSKIG